jgi:hypothetical protein
MIYALQSTDGGSVKIGFSADVDARRLHLESHYGKPLVLLATMPGGRDEERKIHARFAHLRLGRTEQFRPAADLMAFLGRPLLVDANPETVEAMPSVTQKNVFAIRGTDEWKTWVDSLAEANGAPLAVTVEQALRELAVKLKHLKPPKRLP